MQEVALYELPLRTAAEIVQRNAKYYKHRMRSISVINLPWVIKVSISFIYNLLDPFEQAKCYF